MKLEANQTYDATRTTTLCSLILSSFTQHDKVKTHRLHPQTFKHSSALVYTLLSGAPSLNMTTSYMARGDQLFGAPTAAVSAHDGIQQRAFNPYVFELILRHFA